jgi:drug/metabolite transporter (DMT)-like permease
MVSGFFCYATVNALFKFMDKEYSMIEIVFFRNLFALIPNILLLYKTRQWHSLKNPPLKLHFLRSCIGILSLSCLFKSLTLLPLADATVLMFTISLFMALLSIPLLQERINIKSLSAIIAGFLGIIIVANPTGSGSNIGYIFGLGFGLFEAFIILQGRKLTKTNGNAAIVFYYALISSIICACLLPFVWLTPTIKDLIILAVLGIGAGIGQFLVTTASRYAHAGVLGPMTYTMILWSLLYGYFFFSEIPTLNVWLGGIVVILSGLYVINFERKSAQHA